MLLTIFKAKDQRITSHFIDNQIFCKKITEKGYIIENFTDTNEKIFGLWLQDNSSVILVWNTYNLETSLKMTSLLEKKLGLQEVFKQYEFSHDLFSMWLENSYQVMECAFDSKSGERKLVSFNLKNSKQFKQMLSNIKIKFMVFTFDNEKVIITAREEGRLSITPDVDNTKLVNILEKLFGNNIVVASV